MLPYFFNDILFYSLIQLQFVWLLLFVCGDDVYDKVIVNFKKRISQSIVLTAEAKNALLYIINFLSRNKNTFKALHRSIFYITGTYYCLSNRTTRIKYVSTFFSYNGFL